MHKRILVVDDDRLIREMTRDVLVEDGLQVSVVASGGEAMAQIGDQGPFDVVVTDLSMREMDGLELLERIKRASPGTDVIIFTAYASLESALEALRLGASDYLRKPAKPQEILYSVKRTMLRRRIVEENETLRGCLHAMESSRVLTSCLETADVLPLSLDLQLRLLQRTRAVGRLVGVAPRHPEELYVRGFSDEAASTIRERIQQGKIFDPAALDLAGSSAVLEPGEELTSLGIRDAEVLALPLRLDDRIVGALWILSDGKLFRPDEVRRAELLIAQSEVSLVNAERFLQAREKAFVDDVTDLYNARYLMSSLDREVSRAERQNLDLSVVFLDLDRFKRVNDEYGHLVGSQVLRELGALLESSVRSIDTVARYGGDEFTLVLVDTGLEGAMQVAERIRHTVEATSFGAGRGLDLRLTASLGVAAFPAHGVTRESLLDGSDKAMYRGKSLGRNRVCSAGELDEDSRPGASPGA
jgi:diguanylate cyclase (GGDEF)-like protein